MSKSMGHSGQGSKRTRNRSNPYALELKDGKYRPRIVESKVKYNRKRSNKKYTYPID